MSIENRHVLLSIILAFSFLACVDLVSADNDKKPSPTTKRDKKKAAKKARRKEAQEDADRIKAEMGVALNDVSKALVTITTSSNAAGTGFIIKEPDGTLYLYTNQHVIRGCSKFTAKTFAGQTLKPTGFQVSATRDIVRFPLATEGLDPTAALELANSVAAEDPVAVFGNSGGAGVFTSIYGKVLGVGPDRLEVSAKFVPGNSGSPVINKAKKVVGIATYATMKAKKTDWTVQGTRFCDVRRFAFKIDENVKWVPTKWTAYQKIDAQINADKKTLQDVFEVAVLWVRKPYDKISKECKQMDLKIWVSNHNKFAAKIDRAEAKGYATDAKMRALNKMAKSQTIKNYKTLAALCNRRAQGIHRRTQKYGKAITPYLRKEMQQNAKMFEDMAKEIIEYGKELANHDAVVRPR